MGEKLLCLMQTWVNVQLLSHHYSSSYFTLILSVYNHRNVDVQESRAVAKKSSDAAAVLFGLTTFTTILRVAKVRKNI